MRTVARALSLACIAAAGCSSDPAGGREPDDDPRPAPSKCELQATAQQLGMDARAGALHWDASSGSLLVVDDATFRVLSMYDDGSTSVVAGIPALDGDPAGEAIGELAVHQGVVYVPRYGFGAVAAGAVFRVTPGSPAERIAGLSGTARRVALAFTAGGDLLATADEAEQASVLAIDPVTPSESIVASGMGRAGGIARLGTDVLVVDPELGQLSRVDVASGALVPLASDLPALDRIAASRSAAFATGFDAARDTPVLARIEPSGAWSILADLPSRARSVAADDAGRIFVSLRESDSVVVFACDSATSGG